jgi:hypothetical protein
VNATGGAITGDGVVCVGQSNATLSSGLTGGTWASSASSIAGVHAATGLVTGYSVGTANITFTISPGCYITTVVSVNAAVNSITGPTTVVVGNTVTLANATGGGTWSSSNTYKATVVAGTGDLTGVAAGTATITYRVSAGCYRTRTQTMTYTRPEVLAGGIAVFSLYPNPTSGSLTVEASVKGLLTIYTVDGREVAQYAVAETATTVKLPDNLATGVYMCRFNGADGSTEIVRLVFQQ